MPKVHEPRETSRKRKIIDESTRGVHISGLYASLVVEAQSSSRATRLRRRLEASGMQSCNLFV